MKHTAILILSLFVFSCANPNNEEKQLPEKPLDIDAFLFVDRLGILGKPKTDDITDLIYKEKKKLAAELNMPKLELRKGALGVRVWINPESSNGGQVLIMTKEKKGWKSNNYKYIVHYPDLPNPPNQIDYVNYLRVDSSIILPTHPNCNMDSLFTQLDFEGIFTLSDQYDIDGWVNEVNDGITYSIEFVKGEMYGFYSYNCPDVYEDEFIECKKMVRILEVLNKEIGLGLENGVRCTRN